MRRNVSRPGLLLVGCLAVAAGVLRATGASRLVLPGAASLAAMLPALDSGAPRWNLGYQLYDDALPSRWANWSWDSSVSFSDRSRPYSGSSAIQWNARAGWAGLFLHLTEGTLDISSYSHLSFMLRATAPNQKVAVQLYGATGQKIGAPLPLANYGGEPPAGSWRRYDIPLEAVAGPHRAITGVALQNNTATAQPPLYIDRLGLINKAFFDNFEALNPARWRRNGPWATGDPFFCGWLPDHVSTTNGVTSLRLDNYPSSGKPYSAGELGSVARYGYGRFETRLKPVHCSGVITSLFTYTGPSRGTAWHEIDIEFPGDDTTRLDMSYYTEGQAYHPGILNLGFDAAQDFHVYGFAWTPASITWMVDGRVVHTETGALGPLPSLPGQIMVNCWPTTGTDGWAGPFTYPGTPLQAQYDWIKFTPL